MSAPERADAEQPVAERHVPVWLMALAVLVCGAGAAVQSRANGRLAQELGSPALSALWSFGSGWLLLVLGLLALPAARRGLAGVARAVRRQHLEWWELVGGLFGGFFVAVQAWSVPITGVALFTIAAVGGQTVNALLVDRLGLGPAGRQPLSIGRLVAALVTFAGVALASTGRAGAGAATLAVLPVVLGVLAGAGQSVQQAINGKVNIASRHVVATTFVNFTWGTAFLAGNLLLQLALGKVPMPRFEGVQWWMLTGGVIGLVYIAVAAEAVRVLGVLVTALMGLAGQLVAAVLLDLVAHEPVGAQLLLGVAVTLVAAVAAGLAAQRASRAARAKTAREPRAGLE